MLISRYRTVEPLFPDLVIDGSVVEMVSELKILGVILDSKLMFEKQVRAIAASASMRVGILRKTMKVFRDVAVVAKCFWAFILPVLEYCFPVWMSAATSHLSLLDRVVSQVSRISGGSVSCNLCHRRKAQSGISECLLQDWQSGWSPCTWSFSSAVCGEENNPWNFGCSLSIFRDA